MKKYLYTVIIVICTILLFINARIIPPVNTNNVHWNEFYTTDAGMSITTEIVTQREYHQENQIIDIEFELLFNDYSGLEETFNYMRVILELTDPSTLKTEKLQYKQDYIEVTMNGVGVYHLFQYEYPDNGPESMEVSFILEINENLGVNYSDITNFQEQSILTMSFRPPTPNMIPYIVSFAFFIPLHYIASSLYGKYSRKNATLKTISTKKQKKQTSKVLCSRCGTNFSNGAGYCIKCGLSRHRIEPSDITIDLSCPRCNTNFTIDGNYCEACGLSKNKINQIEAE